MIRVAVVIASALLLASSASAVGHPKPTARDRERVQDATRAAVSKLGLVDARACDKFDLPCIDKATVAEEAAFARAATVGRAVARGLSAGKCRTAMLNRANAYNKHAQDVHKARVEWHASGYEVAGRYYYATFSIGTVNTLFTRSC